MKVLKSTLFGMFFICFSSAAFCVENDSFIRLEGGKVTIGSPNSERQRAKDEIQHSVTISPFFVSATEVTQEEYQSVTGTNPSRFKANNRPVENVSWYDAINFCNALSRQKGLNPVYTVNGKNVSWNKAANGYRLLTEAEWEYAARAGTTSVFWQGNQITSRNANFQGHYPYLIEENYINHRNDDVVTSQNRGQTIEVDELLPNGFGLYNMNGNVSEWCFDYYAEYDLSDNTNPCGAESGHLRVRRGGGYDDFAKHLRSAYRACQNPDTKDPKIGFRIARNAENSTRENQVFVTTYEEKSIIPQNPKILVAYFSYTGNTENGAEIISEKTGGDLFEIQMENPYRGNIYETSQADLNKNARPKLSTHVKNMEQYDVILLGYPTWWATLPMPVMTFLEEYDFSGKTVINFSSHGGTRFGDSVSDLSKTISESYIGHGLGYTYSGGRGLENEISLWLKANGIQEK